MVLGAVRSARESSDFPREGVPLTAFVRAVGLVAWAFLLASAGPRRHAYAGRQGNVLAEFDVAKGGDVILLPVRLKGKTYHFAMDTGASLTAYDRSLKPLLGQPISTARAQTNSKPIDVEPALPAPGRER
jgi:hypothetical protein